MDLTYTPEERAFRERVRAFLHAQLRERSKGMDRSSGIAARGSSTLDLRGDRTPPLRGFCDFGY